MTRIIPIYFCLFLVVVGSGCASMEMRGEINKGDVEVQEKGHGITKESPKAFNGHEIQGGANGDMKFYEIKIKYTDQKTYEDLVLQKIKPLIEELEASNLIKGFHFIMHETLDLRLLLNSEDDLPLLNEKISTSGLSDGTLRKWNGFGENSREFKRYGREGINILARSLELNSRLVMSIFQYKKRSQEDLPEGTEKLIDNLNHQIVHYFLNQQGINNLQQIHFSLDDAKFWVDTLSRRQGSPPPDPSPNE